jgi:hypothetical protein
MGSGCDVSVNSVHFALRMLLEFSSPAEVDWMLRSLTSTWNLFIRGTLTPLKRSSTIPALFGLLWNR